MITDKRLPWPTKVMQVCVVVRDLDQTIRQYYELAGIGPWSVWTPQLENMRIRGATARYSMKLALAWTENFMWEVIQPLEGPSIYQEFLDERGEGMHHVLIEASNYRYEQLIADAGARGCPALMEGTWGETDFAYLDTQEALGMLIEVRRRGPNFIGRPKPDYYFPSAPENDVLPSDQAGSN